MMSYSHSLFSREAGNLINRPVIFCIYLRGEAYLAGRQGKLATIEFQQILDHPGIVLNE
jgi:hypothetical protein